MEKNVIQKISLLDNHVIATGGGAVLNHENVKTMKKSGKLVWLRATPETIHKRMTLDSNTEEYRPALTDKGVFEEIGETLSIRNPIYEKAMDIAIDTDCMAPEDICRIIQEKLMGR
jgi:shikimate kinase